MVKQQKEGYLKDTWAGDQPDETYIESESEDRWKSSPKSAKEKPKEEEKKGEIV
jgi:hypothetical protein